MTPYEHLPQITSQAATPDRSETCETIK
uniref:Uncharacterized protein n=1 Tax=Arundo donax TaxID=35708 RepID=A0A0A8ZT45_ARUDO